MMRRLPVMLLALMWLCVGAAWGEGLYMENAWNYVDGSLEVSAGIPKDAEGTLASIRETGVLRVGTEPYFPPQEFIDPSLEGQAAYVGSDMEMARRIAERMGVALEIVPMEFTHVLDALDEGECDLVISALAYTPERASRATLSKGYHFTGAGASSGVLIRAADAERIVDLDSLAGLDIVAQSGSLQEAMTAENVLNYREFRRVDSVQAAYDAVAEGDADAATVDIESAEAYIAGNPELGLALARDIRFAVKPEFDGDRVAARKGEYQLVCFVNGVIDELLAADQYRAWFDSYAEYADRLGM